MSKGNVSPVSPLGQAKLKGWTDYLIIIRERWLVALMFAIALPSLYFYYQIQQPKLYASTAFLIVEPSADRVVNIEEVVNLNTLDKDVMQVHFSQLNSNIFKTLVFESFTEEERDQLLKPYLGEQPFTLRKQLIQKASDAYGVGLNIQWIDKQNKFAIQMRHRDPAIAKLVPNRYVEQYQEFLINRAQESNRRAIDFLTDEATKKSELMDQKWEELRKWREEQDLISLKEQQEFIQEKRKDISLSLTSTEHKQLVLESKIQLLHEQMESKQNPFENPDVLAFGTLSKLKEEKDNLFIKRDLLDRKYLKRHPLVVENEKSIEAMDKRIELNIKALVQKQHNELTEMKRNSIELKKQLEALDDDAKQLNLLYVRADRLQFEIGSNQDSLKSITERQREIEITSRLDSINVKIADKAYTPTRAIEPDLRKISVLTACLAILLFVSVPIGLDAIDNKVKKSWDITHFLKLELLAQVGTLSKVPKSDRMNIARKGLDHSVVESFRDLYSQIGMHSEVDFPKTILITSTIPEEGKSMLASNMASIFGRHGHKTLLMDLDLRRPTLHRSFNLKNDLGLIHHLEKSDPFPGPLTKDPSLGIHEMEPNVHMMCSGGHSRDATEIIVSNKFQNLLKSLHDEYSLIILDTPPLGVFPDALLLAEMADEIIYMIRHGKPKRTAVRNLLHKLRGTSSDLLGVVVNDLPPKKASYYYGHYGYYSYYTYKNYQKYYGNKDK